MPPDDNLTPVLDDQIIDAPVVDAPETLIDKIDKEKPASVRDALKASLAEHKEPKEPSPARQAAAEKRAREKETGKFAPGSKEAEAEIAAAKVVAAKPIPATEKTPEPIVAPQAATIAAPASLSKEIKAKWDGLDPEVRNEFLRREADTQKGVEQLKARYQPLDEVLAPVRPLLQQRGLSEADAVKQLFAWQAALANPNKGMAQQALMALAQSHGINLNQAPAQEQPNDPNQYIQPVLEQTTQLGQRLQAIEQNLTREQTVRVNGEITKFSEGKPHFEKVRYAMGQLMSSGYASNLEDAYNKATWADPDIRQAILDEQNAKREADAKAETEAKLKADADAKAKAVLDQRAQADKARKAAVSPRAGTPAGTSLPGKPQGQSVRDTIRDTLKETGASV